LFYTEFYFKNINLPAAFDYMLICNIRLLLL